MTKADYQAKRTSGPTNQDWEDLLALAEQRLAAARLKVVQLESLIRVFHADRNNGEPSAFEVARKRLRQ